MESREKAPEETYFEFLASMGFTKHIGSMQATEELIELCRIGDGTYILDVGCGVGATPCYLAKTYNCRVVGVDLLERMVEQSRERARTMGVEDRVEFRVADARDLPFDDDLFDAVIVESVNVFFKDKRRAMDEYVRVTRPGGYVGITEMTWLKPPTPEEVEYYRKTVYTDSMEADGWRELLESVGLKDVVANAYKVDIPSESKGRIRRYGCRGMVKALRNVLVAFFREPSSREFLKDVTSSLPKDMLGGLGYGVYAGRKA
jgi:SAM-dependent methyltransferase